MLSQLSRGYGSWVAGYVDPSYGEKKGHTGHDHTLPEIDQDAHFHGVTVGSRSGRSTAMSYATTTAKTRDTNATDYHGLPKTYTTRKGALQLYVACPSEENSDEEEEDDHDRYSLKPKYAQIRRPAGQELIDLSLKFGTIGRLACSVLNFGDKDYNKEDASISDQKNKAFLKFLRSIDDKDIQDRHNAEALRPGEDLNTYLGELRSSSSMRNYGGSCSYVPKNREFLELQALLRSLDNNSWPPSYPLDGLNDRQASGHFTNPASRASSRGETIGSPSTQKSSHKVLSSKQLTASLKSSNYLGRPSSQFSVRDDDDDGHSDIAHSMYSVTSVGFKQKPWTPEGSTEELLIDKYFKGSKEDWETDDGNIRSKEKKRSLSKGPEHLYQGRHFNKGEGHQHDLKCKGDGLAQAKAQQMNQINEEMHEGGAYTKHGEESSDGMSEDESDVNGQWGEHVTKVKQTVTIISDHANEDMLTDQENENFEACSLIDTVTPRTNGPEKHQHTSGQVITDADIPMTSASTLKAKPAVVTLQHSTANRQRPPLGQEVLLSKRRKSLSAAIAFDPEKLKNAIHGPRRRPKSSHAERTCPFTMKDDGTGFASRPTSSKYTYAPTMSYWSNTEASNDMTVPDAFDITKANVDESGYARRESDENDEYIHYDKVDSKQFLNDYDAGIIEEDAILKDIKECNEEVEQIEANVEMLDPSETDSDSGTFVDEDIIRELIEAEENENQQLSGESQPVIQVEMKANAEAEKPLNNTNISQSPHEEIVENQRTSNEDKTESFSTSQVDEVHDEQLSDSYLSQKLSAPYDLDSKERSEDGLPAISKDIEEQNDLKTNTEDQTILNNPEEPHINLVSPPSLSPKDSDTQHGIGSEGKITNDIPIVRETTDHLPDNEIEQLDVIGTGTTNSSPIKNSDDTQTELVASGAVRDEEIEQSNDLPREDFVQGEHDNATLGNKDDEKEVIINEEEVIQDITHSRDIAIDEIDLKNTEQKSSVTPVNKSDGAIFETRNKDTRRVVNETLQSKDIPKVQKVNEVENKKEEKKDTRKQSIHKIPSKSVAQVKSPMKKAENIKAKTTAVKAPTQKGKEETTKGKLSTLDTSKKEGLIDNSEASISIAGIGGGAHATDNIGDDKIQGLGEGITGFSGTDESVTPGTSKSPSPGKKKSLTTDYPLVPPGKRPKAPPEKMKIPEHLKEAMEREMVRSYEHLEKDLERRGFLKDGKVTAIVDESLSGSTLEAVGEGLTEDELEMAKQILQKKIEEAKSQLDGKESNKGKAPKKKKAVTKPATKGRKKKVEDEKSEEELQREAIREKQALEKKKRDEEVRDLQQKIAERRLMLQSQDDEASAKAKELREQMEKLEQEAEDLQRAEDEARDILSEVRKKQREERDARRKADSERRKQEAHERREKEKRDQEEKRRKEMEMMEKIADAEMRRQLREDEERKMYEEERLAQERYEEELREAQRHEEEEEERMRELERQAEEEAMQRLIDEREAAERQRRKLMEEEENMMDIENQKREIMLQEEARLAEERRKIEEQEQQRKQRDVERLMELRRAEEDARQKLNEELDKRRSEALGRRDFNLENKQHVDKLRHSHDITRAWTFSYFVKWPRENYERPMGEGDPRKKVKIKNPAPKKAEAPPAGADNPTDQPTQ